MMKKLIAPVLAVAIAAAALATPAEARTRHMHVMLPNGQTWNNVTDRPGHPWSSDFRVRRYLKGRPAHLVYDRKHDVYRVVVNSPKMYHGYRQAHYAHHQPVHHRPMHHATVRKTTTVRTTTTTTVTPAMGQ